MAADVLEFVVGAEKRLVDLLSEAEILPLLQSAVAAGLGRAAVCDARGIELWSWPREGGGFPLEGPGAASHPLTIEGEPAGAVRLNAGGTDPALLPLFGQLIGGAVQGMLVANLKRILTTEIHTKVVNQTYEEVVESNRRLASSEKKYRDLAENLEKRVQERTEELKRAYGCLLQQEKLASIGQLAAGMAHEINNPIGFVLSNLQTLQKYVARFRDMLAFYGEAVAGEPKRAAEEKWRALKLDYINGDVEEMLGQTLDGVERVKKIVADLRGFSHVDDRGETAVNVNAEVERTLNVLAAELPPGTRVVRQLGEVPAVRGNAAALCQALFNILRNSLQARRDGLQIGVRTEHREGRVRILVGDNGPGVPEEIRHRVFEPFFTTREVGEGMGLGLTVAWEAVKGFGGTIEMLGRSGGGATVLIDLPVERRADGEVR